MRQTALPVFFSPIPMPIDVKNSIAPIRQKFDLTLGSILFVAIHAACLFAWWTKVDWSLIGICVGSFLLRKFGITAGYHRYFSHRSYKTSRIAQFSLAFVGGMAAQKGALWWASHHRHHHLHSDTDQDIHSVKWKGFYWAHVGWVLSREYHSYNPSNIKDFLVFPELVWLNKWHFVPPLLLAITCFLVDGWAGVLWGFCISTVLLYHTTFAINSFCHLFGTQRFKTNDCSRNSWWLALLTLGEGWHNNHHEYPSSSRQGFFWWEVDLTYYGLKLLSWLGLIWDLRTPPKRLLVM